MPAYKNKDNGTWYVMTQYTNWKGERKPKCKRGFDTKREAQEWEHTFRQQNSGDLDMPFSAFVEIYCREQKPRLKEALGKQKKILFSRKFCRILKITKSMRLQPKMYERGKMKCLHIVMRRISPIHHPI